MHSKFKSTFSMKRIVIIMVIGLISILVFVLHQRFDSTQTYYFDRFRLSNDCKKVPLVTCTESNIYLKSISGKNISIGYDPFDLPVIQNSTGSLNGFKKGEKVQVTTSGDDSGDTKVVRKIKAID